MNIDRKDGFIARHGLWDADQERGALELKSRVEAEDLQLIRLAWADPHGYARAKAVTIPTFMESLSQGYNANVATTTLDAAGGRIFRSFVQGGGMGLDEMTGSPNLVIVPDPATFRILPWAPGVGWILCDQYFTDGRPFHFAPRHILKDQLARLSGEGRELVIGLEVEWYVARLVGDRLQDEHVAMPGMRGRPPETAPPEPGFSYHSESNLDIMQPLMSELADQYQKIGLPLRSLENEWGAGQVECTFTATTALEAADNYILFRTASRQVCRRLGYLASFMARPALKGYYASGWHLHQSVRDTQSGRNLFMPEGGGDILSAYGRAFLGGVLEHAVPSSVFGTPTVNGYRRFQAHSLAPNRVTWAVDHRGTMVRVLGGAGDPATRLENRTGEPAANPYLYIASQIVAGLDGVERDLDPGPAEDNPYEADRPILPTSLADALKALQQDTLYREQFGDLFVDYYLDLKQAELSRFMDHLEEHGEQAPLGEVTEWEQNEYFDTF